MATTTNKNNKVYGLKNPLQTIAPEPKVARRNPSSLDKAEPGTVWVNTVLETAFIFVGNETWLEVESSGGTGDFSALNVSGASSLNTLTTSGLATLNSIASPVVNVTGSFTGVNNAKIGTVVFTGNTIANAATQFITLTNSNITPTSSFMASVSSNNVSSNGAALTVIAQILGSGSVSIEVSCIGGVSGLGADDSIVVSYIVFN